MRRVERSDGLIAVMGDVVPVSPFCTEIRDNLPIVANLEAPITRESAPVPGKVVLRADPDWLVPGFGGRLRVASLANNHIMDHGRAGLVDTVNFLDSHGIFWFGVGLTDVGSVRNAVVVELSGIPVGFCGYVCPTTHAVFATADSPGVVAPDLQVIGRDIVLARERGAKRVIVALHWGAEEVPYPRPEDTELARAIVALGADMIMGSHSHCIQPYERVGAALVFYGLGNALMPNLDEPCNYDTEGTPGGLYRKTQRRWNRRSLLVTYSARDGRAVVSDLYWDGTKLRERIGQREVRGILRGGVRHRLVCFRWARFRGTLRNLVAAFLDNPRVPSANHIRALMNRT